MALRHRPLGATGINIAPLSLGTVKLGRNTDVRYPDGFKLPSDDTVVSLLRIAREAGINLIDTAPAYGNSEQRLGRLLPGRRDEWVICTKAGESYEAGHSSFDYSRQGIDASIDRSLDRLNTDFLDIVLIHSNGDDQQIISEGEAFGALELRRAKGDIRLIGISAKTPEGTRAALAQADVVMVTLNEEDQSHLEVIREAHARGTGVLIKKAMASGHADAVRSLDFVLANQDIDSAVVGTINTGHLLANIAAAVALRG